MMRIFYYCSANDRPTGGSKITYRHVEILRELGLEASVVHPQSGFRYDTFDHAPPVLGISELDLTGSDVVVLPEDGGRALLTFARGVRKVLFNQNAYFSFKGFADLGAPLPPYLDPEYLGILVVSEDNQAYLEYAFPGVRVHRIHLSLNYQLFARVPFEDKQRCIAFMTRKNTADLLQVLQILRSRGSLRGWTLAPIIDQSEQGVAGILAIASIFLSFGHQEGISLSNLEALACGCRVIGYSGMGCREYFSGDRCRAVEMGDVIAFVRAVEEEIDRFERGCPALVAQTSEGSSSVRERYSPERERSDLKEFYGWLLAQPF